MRTHVLPTVLLLVVSGPLGAQTSDSSTPSSPPSGFVAGLGLGGGTLGVAGEAYVGAATDVGIFVVRAAGTTDLALDQAVSDASSDVALLYGFQSTREGGMWIRVAAGPALVRSVRRGPRRIESTAWTFRSYTESEESTTAGLAVQLEMSWGRRRAVGLSLLGDVNGESSFAAALVSVHILPTG